jgi:hypothetical protein
MITKQDKAHRKSPKRSLSQIALPLATPFSNNGSNNNDYSSYCTDFNMKCQKMETPERDEDMSPSSMLRGFEK